MTNHVTRYISNFDDAIIKADKLRLRVGDTLTFGLDERVYVRRLDVRKSYDGCKSPKYERVEY